MREAEPGMGPRLEGSWQTARPEKDAGRDTHNRSILGVHSKLELLRKETAPFLGPSVQTVSSGRPQQWLP